MLHIPRVVILVTVRWSIIVAAGILWLALLLEGMTSLDVVVPEEHLGIALGTTSLGVFPTDDYASAIPVFGLDGFFGWEICHWGAVIIMVLGGWVVDGEAQELIIS